MHAEMVCQEKHGLQYWLIFEEETNDFVAPVASALELLSSGRPRNRISPGEAEMGRGYASEIARGVVKHAFEDLHFPC